MCTSVLQEPAASISGVEKVAWVMR